MANTAPGTPYVESSDLVANYPAVSESLAERVDLVGILPFANSTARGTALPTPTDGQYSYLQDTNATEFWNGSAWVAAGTAPGLVHINTTTFTAQSTVSVNSVFSAAYDCYRVLINVVPSTSLELRLRLRVSGTDASGSNYRTRGGYFGAASGNLIADTTYVSLATNSGVLTLNGDFYDPFLAKRTLMLMTGVNGGIDYGTSLGGDHTLTNSYDGFSLLTSTGTVTGYFRVYGYKNS